MALKYIYIFPGLIVAYMSKIRIIPLKLCCLMQVSVKFLFQSLWIEVILIVSRGIPLLHAILLNDILLKY